MCDPTDPKDCIEYIIRGTPAPYNGMLAGPRRAARLTVKAEQCDERLKDAVAEEREAGAVKLGAERDRRASDREVADMKIEVLRRALPGWRVPPELWYVLGVVTGIVAVAASVAGAVAVIDATRPAVVSVE